MQTMKFFIEIPIDNTQIDAQRILKLIRLRLIKNTIIEDPINEPPSQLNWETSLHILSGMINKNWEMVERLDQTRCIRFLDEETYTEFCLVK